MLKRARQYPESTRKAIVWTGVVVVAIILVAWWMGGIGERFQGVELPKIHINEYIKLNGR